MGQFTRKFLSKSLTTGLEDAAVTAPLAEGAVPTPEVEPAVVEEPAVVDVPAPVVEDAAVVVEPEPEVEPTIVVSSTVEDVPVVASVEAADDEPATEPTDAPAEPTEPEPETATEPADPVEPTEPEAVPEIVEEPAPADPVDPVEPAPTDVPAVVEETVPTEVEVVAEAAGDGIVLEDEYAEAVVEANTAELAVDEAEGDVEGLDEVVEGLEAIRATMHRTLVAGGMRGTEMQLASIGIEAYCARVPTLTRVVGSMESANYGAVSGRIIATNDGLEALGETIKNAYEIAKKALLALFEQIKAFVLKVFDYLERLKSRLEKAKERLKGITGSAKESSVELSAEQAGALSAGGSVSKVAERLTTSAKFFKDTISDRFAPNNLLGKTILTVYAQGSVELFMAKDQEGTDKAHELIETVGNEFLDVLSREMSEVQNDSQVSYVSPELVGDNRLTIAMGAGETFIDKLNGLSVTVDGSAQTADGKVSTLSLSEIERVLEGVSAVIESIEYYREKWFGRVGAPESVWVAEFNSTAVKLDNAVVNLFTEDPRTKKFVNARTKLMRLVHVGPTKVLAVLRKGADAALVYAEKSMDQYGAGETQAKAE